jgi:hypothetical protein
LVKFRKKGRKEKYEMGWKDRASPVGEKSLQVVFYSEKWNLG